MEFLIWFFKSGLLLGFIMLLMYLAILDIEL